MTSSAVLMVVFAAATLCVLGVASLVFDLFLRDKSRIDDRIKAAFRDEMRDRARESPLFKDLAMLGTGERLPVESYSVRCQTWIDQAGLLWTPGQLLLAGCATAAAVFGVALLVHSPALASLLAPLALPWPWVAVHVRRYRRLQGLCKQLPEAFEVMSRAIRVGQTMPAALQIVANDFAAPISQEFSHCYEQQHLGVSLETALRDLARRTGVMELRIFVVALIINSRCGGNLADLLSKLASLIRKRVTLHGRMRALTGEGRMQAVVLSVLPFVVFLLLWIGNPTYIQELLDRPLLLAAGVVSQGIGALWIRRIMQVEF